MNQSLALKPDAAAWTRRGAICRDLKDFEQASAGFEQALALDKTFSDAVIQLRAMRYYLSPERNGLLFCRIGWRLGFMSYLLEVFSHGSSAPLIPVDTATQLINLSGSLQEELTEITGVGIEALAGKERFTQWTEALPERKTSRCLQALDALTKGICGSSANSHFPQRAVNWVEYGFRLAMFNCLAESILHSPHPVPPGFDEKVCTLVGAVAMDSDLRARNPRIVAAVNTLAETIQGPPSKEKLKGLSDALEGFRQCIFSS